MSGRGAPKKKKADAGGPSGPYRDGERRDARTGEGDGLVDDLVRQFADPYAFYRELVQNSIDAGASRIGVRVVLAREGERLEARVTVSDDGCGMTQEVLEEDLVVLFRSTKEGKDGAIGKFGIGFVSVLAIAPALVVVSSCTGEGPRHVLHLHPDRTYDLYREPGGERGTSVTLHVPLEGDGQELVERSAAALTRWCGHASVPIHFSVVRATGTEPSLERRIDGALAIEGALVQVHVRSHDDVAEALVALVPEEARLSAFYNRGLLLHESRGRGTRAAIAFKVVSPHLSHTLSREDVRLDDAHARALALVEYAITAPLTDEVVAAIEAATHEHLAGDASAGGRWIALVRAMRAAELAIDPSALAVPLVAPIGASRVARGLPADGLILLASARDALVDVLAAMGTGVVDASMARSTEERDTLRALLAAMGRSVVDPSALHSALVPVPSDALSAEERELAERVSEALGVAHRRPSRIVWVDVVGNDLRLSFSLAHDGAQLALPPAREADPLRLALRPPLALARTHPLAAAARAHPDPVLAADALARAVLHERGLGSPERMSALTELSMRALFESRGRT